MPLATRRTALAGLASLLTTTPFRSIAKPVYSSPKTADDTASLQASLDAARGATFVIPRGMSAVTTGLVLDGPGYDGTRIVVEGELKLLPNTDGYTTGGGPVAAAILVRDCDGVTIDVPGALDGSIGAHTQRLHNNHLVVVAGATNTSIPRLNCRNVGSDGVYVTMKEFNTTSKRTTNLHLGHISGQNLSASGRDLITLIDANGVVVDSIFSLNIGGLIEGQRQPGGFCIECNTADHKVENVVVSSAYIRHQGTGGITCHSGNGSNIRFERFVSINDVSPTDVDQFGNRTQASRSNGFICTSTADIYARGRVIFENAFGVGAVISNCSNPDIELTVGHVQIGARIGADLNDVIGAGVIGGRIDIRVWNACRWGVQEGRVAGSKLIYHFPVGPLPGYYKALYGVYYAAQRANHKNQKNVRTINASYSADWTRLRRKDPTVGPDDNDFDNILSGNIANGYNDIDIFGGMSNKILERIGTIQR
ncbi:MAG: hypothetical protein EOR00_30945 [Mesorhizobium sp.]|uniref:hypothetical protein n=1 Tax=Mesorhizobium sp. TaxID=1871066 RepID=UPI000FE72BB0|nr:hypothetical protein [Mesorhizobium sp.]RWP10331.1 MAG: hypothetical protein EOR00_30945 [Mesorhizobium sp.]